MTKQDATRPRVRGVRLGAELRRLRKLSGLSGREMARRLGIGQATVSRMENAQSTPSLPEVAAWADAAGANAETRANLIALTEAAFTEVDSWRDWMHSGLAAMQAEVTRREANAGLIQNFQPALIPGLLQTAEYARRVFEIVDLYDETDHAAAVAARVERQQTLYDSTRRFSFVLTEGVLRRRYLPAATLAAQLEKIATVATLHNVSIGVLPDAAELDTIPWCGFTLYSGHTDGQHPFVLVETPHAGLTIADPADVGLYVEQFRRIEHAAHTGAEAIRLIHDVHRRVTGG